MPAPGAASTSAVLVGIASLWCVWQKNCGEDGLIGSAQQEAPIQAVKDPDQDLPTSELHTFSMMSASEDSLTLGSIHEIVSPLSISMETLKSKALEKEDFLLGGIEKMESSLFVNRETTQPKTASAKHDFHSAMEKVLSSLTAHRQYLEAKPFPREQDLYRGLNMHADMPVLQFGQTTFSLPSFLTNLLGFGIVVDVLFAVIFIMVCRRTNSKVGSVRPNQYPLASRPPSTIRPRFAQVPAPLPHCGPTWASMGASVIRPTFAQVSAPLPQYSATWVNIGEGVIRPTFVQVAAPSPQEIPEFRGLLPICVAQSPEARAPSCSPQRLAAVCYPSPSSNDDALQSQINNIVLATKDGHKRLAAVCYPSPSSKDALQSQINEIVSATKDDRKQLYETLEVKACSDDALKNHINTIVESRAEQVKMLPSQECNIEYDLQLRASMALKAAEERKHQRLFGASPAGLYHGYPCKNAPSASPSPAALSNVELAYHVHLAVSAAKERSTPARSPLPPVIDWEGYQEHDVVAPCQLNFAEGDDTVESTVSKQEAVRAAEVAALHELHQLTVNDEAGAFPSCIVDSNKGEIETAPFDISSIPSPTRSRARRCRLLAAVQDTESKEEEAQPSEGSFEQTLETWRRRSLSASPEEEAPRRSLGASPEMPSISKRKDISSPFQGSAIQRMLKNSATPQKQDGAKLQGGICRHTTPQRVQEVAMHKVAAFEAWGVQCPDSTPKPTAFMFQ